MRGTFDEGVHDDGVGTVTDQPGGPWTVDDEPLSDDELMDRGVFETAFGDDFAKLQSFADMLLRYGVERGLIGPREVPRIWQRHIVNSAGVASFMPSTGHVIDVGSGAGLPGVVVAILKPHLQVELVEPMERRVVWLREVVSTLSLTNVEVTRARAEQLHKTHRRVDVVTARAVARLEKLASWCLPMVVDGGELVAVKGTRAAEEITEASRTMRRLGATAWEIDTAVPVDGVDGVTVVRVSVDRRSSR